jgi:hypothetical protein
MIKRNCPACGRRVESLRRQSDKMAPANVQQDTGVPPTRGRVIGLSAHVSCRRVIGAVATGIVMQTGYTDDIEQ